MVGKIKNGVSSLVRWWQNTIHKMYLTKEKVGYRITESGRSLEKRNWFKYVVHSQLIVFMVMHLILGLYLAFVNTKYANFPGYAEKERFNIKDHQQLDTICAIICFALVAIGLRIHISIKRYQRIPLVYYGYIAVAAALPLIYVMMSNMHVTNSLTNYLLKVKEFRSGEGNINNVVYEAGIRMGVWDKKAVIADDVIKGYVSAMGENMGEIVKIKSLDLGTLVREMRAQTEVWNKFELYSIINLAVSVIFLVGAIFIPGKKKAKAPKKVPAAGNTQ